MSTRPFFERPPAGERSRQRLLLLSYHFPPDTTVGARRWEKLSHFVAERGWGLDVITCEPDGADLSRLESLPHDVRVYGVPPVTLVAERLEHALWRVYRTVRPVRREVNETPDARSFDAWHERSTRAHAAGNGRGDLLRALRSPRDVMQAYWAWVQFANPGEWARRAAALSGGIVEPGVHFAVVTSGPPHMTHEGGRLVSVRYGIPFVMDMRDPWSLTQRHHETMISPVWPRLAERYERPAIARAALVVANTEPARDALAAAYPASRDRIIAVLNGSDDEPIPPSRHGGRFTIGYAGTIYLSRDPRSLFRASKRVINELGLAPSEFGLELIGDQAEMLREISRQEEIAEFVRVGPTRPHREALEFLARASMLVTFPGWNTITIPAKTYECVRFDAWLLALSDRDSATELLLRGTEADVIPPDDITGIAAVIRKRYEEHARGVRPSCVARDDRFSRRAQARILLDAIARLLPSSGRVAASAEHPRQPILSPFDPVEPPSRSGQEI